MNVGGGSVCVCVCVWECESVCVCMCVWLCVSVWVCVCSGLMAAAGCLYWLLRNGASALVFVVFFPLSSSDVTWLKHCEVTRWTSPWNVTGSVSVSAGVRRDWNCCWTRLPTYWQRSDAVKFSLLIRTRRLHSEWKSPNVCNRTMCSGRAKVLIVITKLDWEHLNNDVENFTIIL